MNIAVSLNGERRELPRGISLAGALADWGYAREEVAAAVNGEFVSRTKYENRRLHADDCVDVVGPVQGG